MTSSIFVTDFIKAAAAPAFGLAVVTFLVGGLKDPVRAYLQALAFALAVCGAFYFAIGSIVIPPHTFADGLSWSALALALFVVVRPKSVNSRYAVRAFFVVLIGMLILWQIRGSLLGPVNLRNLLAFFFLGLGVWSIAERSARVVQLSSLIALPMISVGALSLLLIFKGSVTLSMLAAIVCALLGAVFAVSLTAPTKVAESAIVPFLSVFVIALMAVGHFHLHINPWTMIYLCIPFLILWIRGWIPFVPSSAPGEALVLSAISLIPLGYLVLNSYQISIHHV